jgi:hypothetical protein
MFSFARRALLWLAAAAVKAQDELAALGLDGNLASQESPDIRAKENIRYELTQPQNTLTPTGLLMEGHTTFLGSPVRTKHRRLRTVRRDKPACCWGCKSPPVKEPATPS